MRVVAYFSVAVGLLITTHTLAVGPAIKLDYSSLGTTPIASELKKMSAAWSSRRAPNRITDFLREFRGKYSPQTDIRRILEDAGLECAPVPATRCAYAGVYTYETDKLDGSKIERAANLMEVTVDYKTEPWIVTATSRFLYGGPPFYDQL